MPDIIYLVTTTKGYWDDMLDGFATDDEGIRQIVRNCYRECLGRRDVPVIVDMEKMTAEVLESDDHYEQTYYIREIRGVK